MVSGGTRGLQAKPASAPARPAPSAQAEPACLEGRGRASFGLQPASPGLASAHALPAGGSCMPLQPPLLRPQTAALGPHLCPIGGLHAPAAHPCLEYGRQPREVIPIGGCRCPLRASITACRFLPEAVRRGPDEGQLPAAAAPPATLRPCSRAPSCESSPGAGPALGHRGSGAASGWPPVLLTLLTHPPARRSHVLWTPCSFCLEVSPAAAPEPVQPSVHSTHPAAPGR